MSKPGTALRWTEPWQYHARWHLRQIRAARRAIVWSLLRLHVYTLLCISAFIAVVHFTGLAQHLPRSPASTAGFLIVVCYALGLLIILTRPLYWFGNSVELRADRIRRLAASRGHIINAKKIRSLRFCDAPTGLGILRVRFVYRRTLVTRNYAIPDGVSRDELQRRIETLRAFMPLRNE
ncbi:MAG: hypothetical protein AAGA55_12295 [Planctomycetota bacterium]